MNFLRYCSRRRVLPTTGSRVTRPLPHKNISLVEKTIVSKRWMTPPTSSTGTTTTPKIKSKSSKSPPIHVPAAVATEENSPIPFAFKGIESLRSFFAECEKRLNIQKPEDWYNISKEQITNLGGEAMWSKYPTLPDALSATYPNHKFIHCLFIDNNDTKKKKNKDNNNINNNNVWKDPKHLRDFFGYCEQKLNIQNFEEWYSVTNEKVNDIGGAPLKNYYPSLSFALAAAYPTRNIVHCLFPKAPKTMWNDSKHLRDFFTHYLDKKLKIKKTENYYKVSHKKIIDVGGGMLFNNYSTLPEALSIAFPEIKWIYCLFPKHPKNTFQSKNHLRDLFDLCKQKFDIKSREDWGKVSRNQFNELGGVHLLKIYQSLAQCLEIAYPEENFTYLKDHFSVRVVEKNGQKLLLKQVKKIIPDLEVIQNYSFATSDGKKVTIPVWIPKLKLSLEYQQTNKDILGSIMNETGRENNDDNIISNINISDNNIDKPEDDSVDDKNNNSVSNFDSGLEKVAKENNFNHIKIPHWWDGSETSLGATLHSQFPQHFPTTESPIIPLEEPSMEELQKNEQPKQLSPRKRSLGLHMKQSMMHGREYNWEQDISGWYITEKLDGVRAFWNGSQLFTKIGTVIHFPPFFTEGLPKDVNLDGELWAGYGSFNEVNTAVHRPHLATPFILNRLKYCVFDLPDYTAGGFPKRYERLEELNLEANSLYTILLPFEIAKSKEHIKFRVNEVDQRNGEGLILNHAQHKYVTGRTQSLLKVRNYYEDDVLFIDVDKVNYCFNCIQKNDQKLEVKCTGLDFFSPPNTRTVITIKHEGFNKKTGKYKYPFLGRIRPELVWEEVKEDY